MREILFKAKRIDNDEWVDGVLTKQRHNPKDHNPPLYLQYVIDHEEKGIMLTSFIDPNTVCQYTGLTDKNGTKIFEGDIVEAGYYRWKCQVVWDKKCARFICHTTEREHRFVYVDMVDKNDISALEVIGNIHDKEG